jgi:hypothetical protein
VASSTLASLACDAARGDEKIQAGFAAGIEESLSIYASRFAKDDAKDPGSALSACERAIQLMSELVGPLSWRAPSPMRSRHFRTRYCKSAARILSVKEVSGHGRESFARMLVPKLVSGLRI